MSPTKDLEIKVLKDCYGMCLDWERHAAPTWGASAFWKDLRQVFLQVHEQLFAKLGMASYSTAGWMIGQMETLHEEFPQFFCPCNRP